jgi:hypothetical protein
MTNKYLDFYNDYPYLVIASYEGKIVESRYRSASEASEDIKKLFEDGFDLRIFITHQSTLADFQETLDAECRVKGLDPMLVVEPLSAFQKVVQKYVNPANQDATFHTLSSRKAIYDNLSWVQLYCQNLVKLQVAREGFVEAVLEVCKSLKS